MNRLTLNKHAILILFSMIACLCYPTISLAGQLLNSHGGSNSSHKQLSIITKDNAVAVPDFLLKSRSGNTISLSELQGNIVIINFWATWCRPCRIEMPAMEIFYQAHKNNQLTVLGINTENTQNPKKKQAVDQLTEEMGLQFPILYDDKKSVVRNIEKHILGKNMGLPTTLFIDGDGKLRYIHEGYKKGDDKKYEAVIMQLLAEKKNQHP